MRRRVWRVLAPLALVLAACGEENPAPPGERPILSGFDAMPKQLATIVLTPTPSPVMAGAEVVPVAQPTATPGPPRPTATLTPYVGIFLGEPTSEAGEPAPTLAPIVINPASGPVLAIGGIAPLAGSACSIPVAAAFANAYNANPTVQQKIGCPVSSGTVIYGMAVEPFERGVMFWRSDTRQIYALASSGQVWQVPDAWLEGMPNDDPALSPPPGLLQPVRGFGLAWRSAPGLRDALGWATQPEAPYDAFWQDFERGAMFTGQGATLYALYAAEGQHSGPLAP